MINGNHLEALFRLYNYNEPLAYGQFKHDVIPHHDLTSSVLQLIDVGLVKRVGEVSDEREAFYELTSKGDKYVKKLIGHASDQPPSFFKKS